MTRSERIDIFCREMWSWYARHKRVLPWRDLREKNLDQKAYLVLVSEVMLQQTQVSRVISLYKEFIRIFPHAEALSKASNRDVLLAWRGLGYNNRALRLRDTAREIVKSGGKFPRSMEELQKLPGVGHYTAGAICNFAFGIPTPCLDVNIRRILHRFFVGPENADGTWKKDDRYLLELAEEVLAAALRLGEGGLVGKVGEEGKKDMTRTPPTPHNSADWHAALMDFGSIVCTKNSPKWELMSSAMKSVCMAYGKDITRTKKVIKKEPGRMMAGRFVPNRIFRGRIVEVLRDAKKPITVREIGAQAVADWTMDDHREWMTGLIEGLKRDAMITVKKGLIRLRD